ncbi:hypothetical protein CSQ90_19195 [Janthinobacterium sp. BJB303]|nr:hypothetical protein CSQ90_19195 [Janthinobacterium sp. BJB303]
MKPSPFHHVLSCAALALLLAAPAHCADTPPAPPPQPVAATRLLSVEVLQHYDRARQQRIQEALAYVFDGDAAYKAAYAETSKPLSDRVVGPITLSFISRFWLYYNIEPAGNVTEGSVDTLLQFVGRLKRHPAWRVDLLSAAFGRWIDRQPDKAELYRIRLAVDPVALPPVLARYHAEAPDTGVDAETTPLSVYWYGLTAPDLATIEAQPAYTPAVLRALDPLVDDGLFKTAAEFDEAVQATLKADGIDAAPLLPQLQAAARTEAGYELSQDVLETLQKQPQLPPQLAKLLPDLVGMQFPRRSLFDLAVIGRLRVGLGICRNNLGLAEQENQARLRLGEEDAQALLAGLDPRLAAQLQQWSASGECTVEHREAAPLAALYDRYRPLFDAVVRKAPSYAQSKPIVLESDLCGCNTDNLQGEVYRFYPFWLGGAPQKTDFSLMSRLDYYGMTFDNNGELRMASDGRRIADLFTGAQARQLDFITAARRHRVKVDWVVHRTDWAQWPRIESKTRGAILNRLAANIVRLLETRMTGLPSSMLPWLSFGMTATPVRGDGVTLYFDGYPRDAASVTLYDQFIADLRQRLTVGGFELNIMMRHAELNHGIYRYDKLEAMVPIAPPNTQSALYGWARSKLRHTLGAEPSADDFVQPRYLVLLGEPTTFSKKALREEVEQAIHGSGRMAVLRRMVPVINFDGQSWSQLEDDLIYFEQNFGGVGFWPGTKPNNADAGKTAVPGISRCQVSQLVEDCIQDHFRSPPGEADSVACKFICENRWPLRFALDVLAIALALAGIAYLRWCGVRPVLQKYYLVPLAGAALAAAIFVGLLICDPFLAHLSDGIVIPAALVLCMVAMYFYFRQMLKERDARP